MNLEAIFYQNKGLLHSPYINSAVRTINEYALRYQEVIAGDQYPIIRLLGLETKHSFFEARWANDSPIQNLIWYDVYEQDAGSWEWECARLCLGYDGRLLDLGGNEVNKYGRWVRFAANRPGSDSLIDGIIKVYEMMNKERK